MKKALKILYLIVLLSSMTFSLLACDSELDSSLYTEEIDGFTVAIEKDAQGNPYGKITSVNLSSEQIPTITTPTFTPNGVPIKVIGALSFYRQKMLEVNISEGIETIENFAFGYCAELVSAALPSTIKTIGNFAFVNTRYLGFITILAENPPELGSNAFKTLNENSIADDKYEIPENLVIKVPSAEKYNSATVWSEYSSHIVKN